MKTDQKNRASGVLRALPSTPQTTLLSLVPSPHDTPTHGRWVTAVVNCLMMHLLAGYTKMMLKRRKHISTFIRPYIQYFHSQLTSGLGDEPAVGQRHHEGGESDISSATSISRLWLRHALDVGALITPPTYILSYLHRLIYTDKRDRARVTSEKSARPVIELQLDCT